MTDVVSRRPLEELDNTMAEVDALLAALDTQRELARQRGMSLPPMVKGAVRSAREELEKLRDSLAGEETELGQLRALVQLAARITTSLDVEQVLQETLEVVITLTRAERGYLILVDADDPDRLDYRIGREESGDTVQNSDQQPFSQTIVRDVLASGEPLLVDNAYKDERLQERSSVASLNLRAVLCVPLLYKGVPTGVVYVDNRWKPGIFTQQDATLLLAFANTAAVAIANARMYAEIQALLREMTQVKELMDHVFTSVGSGIIATDSESAVTIFNRAAETILETDADRAIGAPLDAVLPALTADLHDRLSEVRQQSQSQTIDGELTTGSKGRIAVSVKLSPLKDTQERVQGVAVMLDDVTEKIERDAQLRMMKTYLPPEMVDNIHTISNLALGGERREVTCLFAEVRPLVTLKHVRPVEIMALLNRYLEVASAAIHDTGGIIDKYMGNEVMALYNTQLVPERAHAQQAIEAALAMRKAFIELYAAEGIDPQPHYYRIGIHTGVATLGNVGSLGRRDFTAIGDTINLSKRLEENAGAGQIIVSENTHAELMQTDNGAVSLYRFEELTPIRVKGRQQQTRIYEVFRA